MVAISRTAEKCSNSFEQMMDQRYCEAKRSIVVQVLSEQSYKHLHSYCGRFGNIVNSYYYVVKGTRKSLNANYILLEFEHPASAAAALGSSTVHRSDISEPGPPVKSRFMWFASNKNGITLTPTSISSELVTNQVAEIDPKHLHESLIMADSISGQMEILYDETQLNELAVRMRFMTALQIEELFSGIYLDTRVYPFGSSVNGYGKLGSDLDIILKPMKDERQKSQRHSDSRLFFHEKEMPQGQQHGKKLEISALAQVLAVLAPGIENVMPIPKARIPIVKYYQTLFGLHVDLSLSNM